MIMKDKILNKNPIEKIKNLKSLTLFVTIIILTYDDAIHE